MEIPLRQGRGSVIFLAHYIPWFDDNGEVDSVYLLATDITATRRGEEALRSAADVVRTIPSGLFIYQYQEPGRLFLLEGNPAAELLSRIEIEAWRGRDFSEIWPGPAGLKFKDALLEVMETGNNLELEHFHYNDDRLDGFFHVRAFVLPGLRLGVAFEDITEKIQAQRELREKDNLFQEIFDHMSNGVAIYQPVDGGRDFVFKDLNQSGLDSGGKNREEVVGKSVREVFPGVEALGLFEVFKRVYRTGWPERHPSSIYTDEKLTLWVENYVCKLPSGDLMAVYDDTTARMQAELSLKESRERLSRIIQNMPVLLDSFDDKGNLLFWNRECERVTGYSSQEMVMNPRAWELLYPDEEYRREVFATVGREWGDFRDQEWEISCKDGGTRVINWSNISAQTPIPGWANWAVGVDVTQRKRSEEERKRLQEELRQSQKMEAIGTLASGIAHDFNNLLAAIMGYAELAADELPMGHPANGDLTHILTAAGKARGLVRQILTFSRKAESFHKVVDINLLISEAVTLLERAIPKMVLINFEPGKDLGYVKGDKQQMEQVVMNLGVNAADSMPEGGMIILQTKRAMVHEKICQACGAAFSGDFVILAVSDTGHGMPPEVQEKIFDPFFTTKEVGKGTGLGLSTVFGIVNAHGGHIQCRSTPGHGTDFIIYLPATSHSGDLESQRPELMAGQSGRNETIMVVDDEAPIREIARRILENGGYRVLSASCGEEALKIFDSEHQGIEAVILDLGMPGIGGVNCLEKLVQRKPSLKVLIASGYIQHEDNRGLREKGAADFLSKPFKKAEILARVRAVLRKTG